MFKLQNDEKCLFDISCSMVLILEKIVDAFTLFYAFLEQTDMSLLHSKV